MGGCTCLCVWCVMCSLLCVVCCVWCVMCSVCLGLKVCVPAISTAPSLVDMTSPPCGLKMRSIGVVSFCSQHQVTLTTSVCSSSQTTPTMASLSCEGSRWSTVPRLSIGGALVSALNTMIIDHRQGAWPDMGPRVADEMLGACDGEEGRGTDH